MPPHISMSMSREHKKHQTRLGFQLTFQKQRERRTNREKTINANNGDMKFSNQFMQSWPTSTVRKKKKKKNLKCRNRDGGERQLRIKRVSMGMEEEEEQIVPAEMGNGALPEAMERSGVRDCVTLCVCVCTRRVGVEYKRGAPTKHADGKMVEQARESKCKLTSWLLARNHEGPRL